MASLKNHFLLVEFRFGISGHLKLKINNWEKTVYNIYIHSKHYLKPVIALNLKIEIFV